MKVLLNGSVQEEEFIISYNNRSFLFGDGLFETIIFNNNEIRFCEDHLNRLQEGMQVIGLKAISSSEFKSQIARCIELNNLDKARIKFLVFRRHDQLPGYKTSTNEFGTLIITKPLEQLETLHYDKIGVSQKVVLSHSLISPFKTMNSLPYVLAENEKLSNGLEEIILLDTNSFISECAASNIFWIKDDKLFTSPLSTGCKDGIMRKQIMKLIKTEEVKSSYNDLTSADGIFCTNVARLGIFTSLGNHKLNTSHPIINKIKPLWVL